LVFALALVFGIPALGFAEGATTPGDVSEGPIDDPDPDLPDDPDAPVFPDDGPGDSAHVQQKLATKFGVDEADIAGLRDQNLGYGEIDHTLTLAERLPGGITDENVAHVLEQRQGGTGWGQIAHAQGTTLGNAKKEFPTQPVVEPPPEPTPVATTGATAEPKSLSRPGKSTLVASSNGKSGQAHADGSLSRGGSSKANRPDKAATAGAGSGRGGHAYGRGGSGGAKLGGSGNGKAKGRAK
jgi:hypothetical protein